MNNVSDTSFSFIENFCVGGLHVSKNNLLVFKYKNNLHRR